MSDPTNAAAPGDAADEPGTPAGRRVIELLWDPPGDAARGPRKKLTLEAVVQAAIEMADADGFDALTMRALARRLGVGAMSLYTYVPGKSELFELMIDRAYAARSIPSASLPWRERYATHARQARAMYRAHPWLLESNLWRLPLGPGILDVSEDMLAVGQAAGLSYEVGVRVSSLLESYVFGLARGEIADQSAAMRTGESVDDYWEARSSFWGTHFSATRFPTMLRTWESGAYEQGPDRTAEADVDLEFALDLILDSIERLARDGVAPAGREDPPPRGSNSAG